MNYLLYPLAAVGALTVALFGSCAVADFYFAYRWQREDRRRQQDDAELDTDFTHQPIVVHVGLVASSSLPGGLEERIWPTVHADLRRRMAEPTLEDRLQWELSEAVDAADWRRAALLQKEINKAKP